MILSVVIPCLNEEETISICIEKCIKSFERLNIKDKAELIIADNGSTDNSINIATELGAKIVNVSKKGYGNAIMGGIKESKGKYIIMGDADNSYDFNEIDKIYIKLLEGNHLVQGCRFPIGGGKILKNAMPLTHKYIGNPLFSFISKLFFSLPFNDVYCGFRGFDKEHFTKLNHFSGGMVFAIENLIKFNNAKLKCSEIPITLHKDGRIKNKSHLNTISDGWKTLRFLLIACPKWLYFIPSIILLFLGLVAIFDTASLSDKTTDLIIVNKINTIFIFFILSFQCFMFGIFSSLQATKLKLNKYNLFLKYFFKIFKLKYAFLIGFIITLLIIFKNYLFNFNDKFADISFSFLIFFVIILIANSLFISLLTIDEQ